MTDCRRDEREKDLEWKRTQAKRSPAHSFAKYLNEGTEDGSEIRVQRERRDRKTHDNISKLVEELLAFDVAPSDDGEENGENEDDDDELWKPGLTDLVEEMVKRRPPYGS